MTSLAPPLLDPRAEAEILAAQRTRARAYLPGLAPAPLSAADALERIAAGYAGTLGGALNDALSRAQLAFLDAAGEARLPAQAAVVPLVFTLAEQSVGDVPLPKGTSVGVKSSGVSGDAAPAFVVSQSIALARAKLAAFYSVDPRADRWDDHGASVTSEFTLFTGNGVIEHAIYLGQNQLFNLPQTAKLILSFTLLPTDGAPAAALKMKWEYRAADAWWPLEGNIADLLITEGQVKLEKRSGPPASEFTLLGQKSYWIRGSLVEPLVGSSSKARLPVIDRIRTSLDFGRAGLAPDAMFADNASLDASAPFFPFGQLPTRGTTFYLGSSEVFSRPGVRVRIDFRFASLQGLTRAAGAVTWEYFDGTTWVALPGVADTTNIFLDTSAHTGTPPLTPDDGFISFITPRGWQPVTRGRKTSHFLRVRLDGESVFGSAPGFVTDGATPPKVVGFSPGTLKPPLIGALTLSFSENTEPTPIDHVFAANAGIFVDCSDAARSPQSTFAPFVPTDDQEPAVYFGFDRALPVGLVSLYVEVAAVEGEPPSAGSPFVWEYHSARGFDPWQSLQVVDGTDGFQKSGLIQFIGPVDVAASDGIGGSLFRIRARLKRGAALPRPSVRGVWLNAVMSTHASFFGGEVLGTTDGLPRQSLSFPAGRTPIHEGELTEVREWVGRDRGYETIANGVPPEDRRVVRDPLSGEVAELWIRWRAVQHLFGVGPNARVYTLERVAGLLRFGDGEHGLVPPAGSLVSVAFTTGGGVAGNVPAGTVRELRAALSGVASVTNPRPAQGGAESEAIERTRRRGAERLRHRGRALSPSDFSWLALQASPAVARARCLPTTGPAGAGQVGWVSVVIVPSSNDAEPQPDTELSARVQAYLAAHGPATLARRIRVLGPKYRRVSVVAELVPTEPERAVELESLVRQQLDRYLHPLLGGLDGAGWEVGQAVPLSEVAALLEAIPGIDFARDLRLEVAGAVQGDAAQGEFETLVSAGVHELKFTLQGEAC